MKKITQSIYSEKPTKIIMSIENIQFNMLRFFSKIKVDFIKTKTAIIVGIKNQ